MATQTPPPTARKHYALSALLAARAVSEVRKARPRGLLAAGRVLASHQMAQAVMSERAVAAMLSEQDVDAEAEALLSSPAFTTSLEQFERMLTAAGEAGQDRLVESLVQDAGRSAESVAIATRADIYHVRYVSPPCCGRCAVLAGRVYRYSEGFLRHPNCDCVMIPTTVAAPFAQNPDDLFREGKVRGLSKADARAIADGADLSQVVNVRSRRAGLTTSGRVLARSGRPTPEGIYALASTREDALELLRRYRYIT